MKKSVQEIPPKRITLRDECLAENKELGLEPMQEQMDFVFKVLHQHGINSRLWMEEYVTACHAYGMQAPPDFEKFLPWNLSPEARKRLSRDCTFSCGKAQFLQMTDGTVYHLREDGLRTKVNFGEMTGDEFDKLTGISTSADDENL